LGKFYDNSIVPAEMRRDFNIYDRIKKLGIDLGTFDDNVKSLAGANIAGATVHQSGLVYLSGLGLGPGAMYDDPDRIKEGQKAGRDIADSMIKRLHWVLACGKEGGDLNDVLYTVKALGMVVSTDVFFNGAPAVTNGFSLRWQSVFGGGGGEFAKNGEDQSYSGLHARSALGGFTGRFSQEPEIIVAVPPEFAVAIIKNRGWVFPLPPAQLEKVKGLWK
jgi:hypothetical protein